MRDDLERRSIPAEAVLTELARIATADWREFVTVVANPKTGDVLSVRMDLSSKVRALELLGKAYGLFTDRLDISGSLRPARRGVPPASRGARSDPVYLAEKTFVARGYAAKYPQWLGVHDAADGRGADVVGAGGDARGGGIWCRTDGRCTRMWPRRAEALAACTDIVSRILSENARACDGWGRGFSSRPVVAS